MMPITSIAVMLPNGNMIVTQPETTLHRLNIHGLEFEPMLSITRAEASGLRDILNMMFPAGEE